MGLGSMLQSVGTGFTDSAYGEGSLLSPEMSLHSPRLQGSSIGSVGVPSSRSNENSQNTSLSAGDQILMRLQKEGLFNFNP